MMRRAAFLDRDGVLNVDRGYVHRIEDYAWLPGAVEALRRLQQAGYALVIVTNQSGIARGLYSEAQYRGLMAAVRGELAAQGVRLADVVHCPHHPKGVVASYRAHCACRKPGPGLLLDAADRLGLDLPRSILAGDRASDIAAGRRAGVGRCFLVGHGPIGDADGVFPSLLDCVQALCEPHCEMPQ